MDVYKALSAAAVPLQISFASDRYEVKVNNESLGPLHGCTIRVNVATHLGVQLLVRARDNKAKRSICIRITFSESRLSVQDSSWHHVVQGLMLKADFRCCACRAERQWMGSFSQHPSTASMRACAQQPPPRHQAMR